MGVRGAGVARRAVHRAVFPRSAARRFPTEPNAVLSPADGRVVLVEQGARSVSRPRRAEDQRLHERVQRAFQSQPGRRHGRATAGITPAAFVNAALDKASLENERNALHITTASGVDVTCVQIAGLIARRILCYVGSGDTLRAASATASFASVRASTSICRPPHGRESPSATCVHATSTMLVASLPRLQRARAVAAAASCLAATGPAARLPPWVDYPARSARSPRIAFAGAASTCCPICSRPRRCSPASTRSCRR